MCGIAGIVKWTREAPAAWRDDALRRMSQAIAQRGPDGAGIFVDPRERVTAALVHRRLAIIDRAGGAQPMGNEDGLVQVVFNGAIYNHALLRRELQTAGHVFASDHSDTEVLVHGWEQWGTDLPAKLRGMFAFAIWDMRGGAGEKGAGTLFLARDRMGQKPLFYAPLEDGIVFGSTIGSVLAWPEVPRRVPLEQVGLYLLLGYIPPPQTIYRDVSQVMPGAWVRLRNDVLDGKVYWRGEKDERGSEKDERRKTKDKRGRQAALRAGMGRAVESQLVADVPVACFLSGGIDSSIVAALMQRAVGRAGGGAIQTVAVGFQESAFDETAYAAAVARKIGSNHARLEVNASQDVMATLEMLMATSLGQPFADSSIVPTYHLSRAVRAIAPVALSGDGADELFGGYDRYRAMSLLARWGPLARFMPKSAPLGSTARRERYRRLAAAARAADASDRYTRLVEIFPRELAEELLGEPIVDWLPGMREAGAEEKFAPLPPVAIAMMRDQREYLPGDVLWKVDSASMSAGQTGALEVRSPFLDHGVVELANSLPLNEKIRGGVGKWILREAFRGELPVEVAGRGKKGFAVPVGDWFKGPLRTPLTDLLFARNSFTVAHLKKSVVERILEEHLAGLRDHTHRLFSLLMLELWWRAAGATLER